MKQLPTISLGEHEVTRLVLGGNPFSGYSHTSAELDWEMIRYHTMPNLQATLDEAWQNGINTCQTRGDRLMMRMILEHHENGGRMKWIAQTASEFSNINANIHEIIKYAPIAVYHHGTHVDNSWHSGRIEEIHDIVKTIKDAGLPAGIASHIPEVIEYAEEHGWETDFYLCCFYNLARGYKSAPAVDRDAYARERYPEDDPPKMTTVIKKVQKPCFAYKVLAAGRRCADRATLKNSYEYAFSEIKPSDAVIVGMFQKYCNQAKENSELVREIIGGSDASNK